ncbi:MAG: hypothetical protein KF819_29085 [Labilithrix sp.]|nr:hypothetical protein [Labilithrix sp.]
MKKTAVLGAIAFALVACGKKDEAASGGGGGAATTTTTTGAAAKSLGACNKLTNVGKCTEYDMSKDTLGLNKGGCEATDGKWETSACPSEKQFANCATSETKIFYYAGTTAPGSVLTMDEEFAKLDCEMMSGKLTVTGSSKVEEPKPAAAKKAATPAAAPAKKK